MVCGGRTYGDRVALYRVLDELAPDSIIAGGARGADTLAYLWAGDRNIECLVFMAEWRRHGRRAGSLRNQRMLDEGRPDCVVAFPGGHGTADMVARAMNAGLPIHLGG